MEEKIKMKITVEATIIKHDGTTIPLGIISNSEEEVIKDG